MVSPYSSPLLNSTGGTDMLNYPMAPGSPPAPMGAQPMNLLPQQGAAQPGQPSPFDAFMKILQGLFQSSPMGQLGSGGGAPAAGGGGSPFAALGAQAPATPPASPLASFMMAKKPPGSGGLY